MRAHLLVTGLALACGIAAESLRARSGIPMREGTAFTAGILHELGSIVIAQSAIARILVGLEIFAGVVLLLFGFQAIISSGRKSD